MKDSGGCALSLLAQIIGFNVPVGADAEVGVGFACVGRIGGSGARAIGGMELYEIEGLEEAE